MQYLTRSLKLIIRFTPKTRVIYHQRNNTIKDTYKHKGKLYNLSSYQVIYSIMSFLFLLSWYNENNKVV